MRLSNARGDKPQRSVSILAVDEFVPHPLRAVCAQRLGLRRTSGSPLFASYAGRGPRVCGHTQSLSLRVTSSSLVAGTART